MNSDVNEPTHRPVAADTIERTDHERASDPATILAAVREVVPLIVASSEEIECRRRLPLDVVDASAGGRMLPACWSPAASAALKRTWPNTSTSSRELACADGSVSWTVMIGSSAPVVFGKLPLVTLETMYAHGPDVVGAGTFNPAGTATVVDGGFRASGRWGVRQRVRARGLVPRPLHRRRRQHAATADDGASRERGPHHRHMDGVGAVRHGKPRLRA